MAVSYTQKLNVVEKGLERTPSVLIKFCVINIPRNLHEDTWLFMTTNNSLKHTHHLGKELCHRTTWKQFRTHLTGCSWGLSESGPTCLSVSTRLVVTWFQDGQELILPPLSLLGSDVINKIHLDLPHFDRNRHTGAGFWVFWGNQQ